MAIKTAGTRFFIIDPQDETLLEIPCVTSISGMSAARDQVDITCLQDQARSFVGGLMSPSAFTAGIHFDPSNPVYARLYALYLTNETFSWAIGYPDGTAPAPLVAEPDITDGAFDIDEPTNSWIVGEAYINDFPQEFQVNEVVTSEVSFQVSGLPEVIAKASP